MFKTEKRHDLIYIFKSNSDLNICVGFQIVLIIIQTDTDDTL